MDRSTAKDLVHIDAWLALVATIATEGQDSYRSDALLQEAGDSLRSIAAGFPGSHVADHRSNFRGRTGALPVGAGHDRSDDARLLDLHP